MSRPNVSPFGNHGLKRRPRPLPWVDDRVMGTIRSRKAGQEFWIVQTNKSERLTAKEYATLQNGYDYFNVALFDGALAQLLITLQRHGRALGYFSADRFRSRTKADARVHEVALNPERFRGKSDEEVLSTLVHEMAHVWQREYGKAGRGRYHNRQFAAKMHSIGLMPSATGKEGGAVTGDHMSHYILTDGKFIAVCRRFLEQYHLTWESAVAGRDEGSEDNNGSAERTPTRAKFTCPNCGDNAWAKPSARLDCHVCSAELGEQVEMLCQSDSEA